MRHGSEGDVMTPTTTAVLPAGTGYWAEFEGDKQFAWACAFRRAAVDCTVTVDGKTHLGAARFVFPNGDVGWSPALFRAATPRAQCGLCARMGTNDHTGPRVHAPGCPAKEATS